MYTEIDKKESRRYKKKKESLRNQGFRILPQEEIGGQKLRWGNKIIPRKYDINFPFLNSNPVPIAYLFLDGNIRRVRWEKNPALKKHLEILYGYFNKISKKNLTK